MAPQRPGFQQKVLGEIRNLGLDVLSARCIADRLKLHYGVPVVAQMADTAELAKIQSNLLAVIALIESITDCTGQKSPHH